MLNWHLKENVKKFFFTLPEKQLISDSNKQLETEQNITWDYKDIKYYEHMSYLYRSNKRNTATTKAVAVFSLQWE